MRKKHRRRTIDQERTLRAFECRFLAMPQTKVEELNNKWLSSYDIYDLYFIDDDEITQRYNTKLDSHIWRLAYLCLQRGVRPRGIVSARIKHGQRIASVPRNERHLIKHVGRGSVLLKAEPCEFSLLVCDKRYVEPERKIPAKNILLD